jgi:hypothetical protein
MNRQAELRLLRQIDRTIASRRSARVYFLSVGHQSLLESCAEQIIALEAERVECVSRARRARFGRLLGSPVQVDA